MRTLKEIIIHCSATQPGWMAGQPVTAAVAEIDRWHLARGWSGIGYHYVIDRKGVVGSGRDLAKQGAHTSGHNSGTVGICLLGGYGSNENDQFADNYTPEQDRTLRDLIARLEREYPTIKTISGHNQYAAKACPGFQVYEWIYIPPKINPFVAFIAALKLVFGGRS